MIDTIPKSVLAVCLTLLAAPMGALAAESPSEIVDVLQSRINAHDVDGSADLFGDDAVVVQPRVGGMPQVYVGHEQIRWWLRGLVAQHVELSEARAAEALGTELRWSASLGLDAFRELGVESVETESRAMLGEDGRIQSLTTVFTSHGARRLQQGPTPVGDESTLPLLQTFLSAAALLGVGFGAGAATVAAVARRRTETSPGLALAAPQD